MLQPSNLAFQEDLVFGDMILNLETENEYLSGEDAAFSLSLGEITEPG